VPSVIPGNDEDAGGQIIDLKLVCDYMRALR